MFKIFNGIADVKQNDSLLGKKGELGAHGLKLVKPSCRIDCIKYDFSNSVFNLWNQWMWLHVTVFSFKHKTVAFLSCQGFV